MYIYIYSHVYHYIMYMCIYIYIHREREIAHQKSTPPRSSWIVSGIFQWSFTCQWYVPKDCHSPSAFQRKCPTDSQRHLFQGIAMSGA